MYSALLRRQENGKYNRKMPSTVGLVKKPAPKPESNVVIGNRIINVKLLQKEMYCEKCFQPLHIQNIEKEKTHGLASTFDVRCDACSRINKMNTSEKYKNPITGIHVHTVNSKIVLGI